MAVQDETNLKDKKIKQLEMQLSLTVEEKVRSQKNFDMLLEELQTLEFSSTLKTQQLLQQTPEPSKPHMSFRQRLLRKQHSSISFFNTDGDKNASPSKKATRQRKFSGSPSRSRAHNTLSNGDTPHCKIEAEDDNKLSVLDKLRHHSDQNINRKYGDEDNSENVDSGSKACAIM